MSCILVADDDADVLDVVATALTRAGHDVRRAGDGFEAMARAVSPDLDLLVLDVIMPGRTGLDVLVALRAELLRRQPMVLLMSSLASRAEVRSAFVAGADDVIAKPFRPAELVERVAMLLDERASSGAGAVPPGCGGTVFPHGKNCGGEAPIR